MVVIWWHLPEVHLSQILGKIVEHVHPYLFEDYWNTTRKKTVRPHGICIHLHVFQAHWDIDWSVEGNL